jgi:hypothetical protein
MSGRIAKYATGLKRANVGLNHSNQVGIDSPPGGCRMHIWSLTIDGDKPEFFTEWSFVLEWITLLKTEQGEPDLESITVELVYVNGQ